MELLFDIEFDNQFGVMNNGASCNSAYHFTASGHVSLETVFPVAYLAVSSVSSLRSQG